MKLVKQPFKCGFDSYEILNYTLAFRVSYLSKTFLATPFFNVIHRNITIWLIVGALK